MTIECPKKIEKLLKSYYGDDFRLDMNLVSIADEFIGTHEKPYGK